MIIRNNIKATFLFSIAGFKFHGSMVFRENYRSNHQRRCSVEKVFLKISQNSQENTCTRITLLKKHSNSCKKNSDRGAFLWILKKKLSTLFLQNISGRIFLKIQNQSILSSQFLSKTVIHSIGFPKDSTWKIHRITSETISLNRLSAKPTK